jgi:PmbA protein
VTFDEAKRLLLDWAKARGIDAEVLGSETRELTLGSHEGALHELTHARRGGVGVRVVVSGATGYAYSEDLSTEALAWTLDEAVDNARLHAETDGFLPASRPHAPIDLLDEGLSGTLADKGDAVRALDTTLRDDPETSQVWIARYSERETREVLGSTRGAEGAYRNGFAMLLASFVARRGDSLKQSTDVDLARDFHALDPAATASTMLAATSRLLGAEPLPTGRYRTWFEPGVVASLLGVLLHSLSGKALAEGTSALAGKVGERIGSEAVTLVDDPTLDGGLASRPFDSEGTGASRTVLVERGVFRSFLHNSATAAKTGQENTGHAVRSYKTTLGVGPSNLVLETGDGVDPDDGVIVTDVMGVHAGANPVTGDFSLQGLGLRVQAGERTPVENFALSGNLFDLLEAVERVGDRAIWRPLDGMGSAALVPWIEVEQLSFAGA